MGHNSATACLYRCLGAGAAGVWRGEGSGARCLEGARVLLAGCLRRNVRGRWRWNDSAISQCVGAVCLGQGFADKLVVRVTLHGATANLSEGDDCLWLVCGNFEEVTGRAVGVCAFH